MSEFLHEGGASSKTKLPRRRGKKPTPEAKQPVPEAPVGRKRAASRKPGRYDPGLDALMKDFTAGVSRLRGLTDRLSQGSKPHQPEFKSDRPAKPTPVTPDAIRRHMPPSIAKIVEREIKTVSEQAPRIVRIRDKGSVTKEYETRVHSVVQQHLPQVYAAVLRAEREIREKQAVAKPASVVFRPNQPAVRALMRAARAIRSGRLPFLDRRTREQAQVLLERIWGTKHTERAIQSRDIETRRLIEQHRLIPLAVREDVVQSVRTRARKAGWKPDPQSSTQVPPPEFIRDVEREIVRLLPMPRTTEPQRASPAPVAAHDIPRLIQQGVPAFQTQGVAAGGSYVMDPGEAVHVITRDSSPLATTDSPTSAAGQPTPLGRRRQSAAAEQTAPLGRRRQSRERSLSSPAHTAIPGEPGTPAAAPRAARHSPPPVQKTGVSQTAGGLGAETGGGTAGGQGGPVELRGRLEIPGLAGWMADIEGRLKGRG